MDQAYPADPPLADLLNDVWLRLDPGVAERNAPARHLVLATVGRGGGGEARTVVLRAADRRQGLLCLHTDSASAKVAELTAQPLATLLLWDPPAQVQARLRCTIAARPGTDEEWQRVPDPSRRAYGGGPPPGRPILSPGDYGADADRARFTVLEAEVAEIDVLHLGGLRHLRARFARSDGWQGQWLAP